MNSVRELCARVASFVRQRKIDREFDEELAAHIELATEDYRRQGMAQPEARRQALIKLGGIEPSRQLHRDTRGLPSLDGIIQDVRYAVRSLRHSPAFTLTAIAMLALGMGVNTAVFTLTNAVLFKGLSQVVENDRVVYLASGGAGHGPFVSYPDFQDWRTEARSFEGMGAVNAVRVSLSDQSGFPETYNATQVSANTFALLGHPPRLGRDFTGLDEMPGAAPVAILDHDFWERRYGKDPAIVGRTIRINGMATTVIGVMAEGFSFPRAQELWLPLVPTPDLQQREVRTLWFAFGRLADGATIETARAEMATIGRGLAIAYPQTNQGMVPAVRSFSEFFVGPNVATGYASMLCAVGLVLLIACANLAILLLGRAIGRSREMSLRLALGAGRWRIIRQVLIECVMLSAMGSVLGWLIATWGVRAYELTARPPGWFDRALDYSMDYRVFAYLVAIAIGTGLLFGLAPARRLWRLDVNATLKDGGRGAAFGRRGQQLSGLLVMGEMALAVVLLAGAGMMIRSFLNIYTTNLGIRTDNVLTAFVELTEIRYSGVEAQVWFFDRLTARLAAIPGVESVTLADRFPTQGARRVAYELPGGSPMDEEPPPGLSTLLIGSKYFETLGAQVLAGREFNDFDSASGIPVAIVNQRLASEYWPGEGPLGKRLRLSDGITQGAWLTIVGVVPNIVQSDIVRHGFDPLVYLPYRQTPVAGMWLVARARVPPDSLAVAVRREVQALDSDLPLFGTLTLADRVAEGYRNHEFLGGVFLMLAAIALLLAATGLYAAVAHSVRQRTQEIGIRTAMGATARDVLELVVRQGLRPVGLGLVIGLAAALAVTPVLESQLVGVSAADPVTYVVASAVLVLSAILGCLIPARRAMRVDPVVALRHE